MVSIKLRKSGLWTEAVWQKGFHDHALRQEESLLSSAEYVLNNPVRAGLTDRWQLWPHFGGSWVDRMLAGNPPEG
jgi:REP element-mobilizing transposase RayT